MQNNQTNFGALWNGSPQYATKNQLLSTSQGLETEISSIVASGAVNTWATFPAITNVNMAGFNLSNAATLSTMNINVSSLNGATINVGGIVITNSTITNGGVTINGGNITNNNTTTSGDTKSKTYTVSDVVTAAGAAIDSITDSVEALGGVFSAAEGAATIAQVAYGVGTIASGVQAANGVVDLATKGASLFTTRTANTISGQGVPGQTTAVYETVNGTTQLQFSTLNAATTTVFRTTDKTNPNQKFGNESFLSTIIPAGSLCVRSVSDPLQFQMISTQLISTNNYLQSYGQWTRIFEPNNSLTANSATISVLSTARTYISSINDSIRFTNQPIGNNIEGVNDLQVATGTFNTSLTVNGNLTAGSCILDTTRVTGLFRVTNVAGVNVATIDTVGAITGTSLNTGGQVNAATGLYTGLITAGGFLTASNAQAATLTVTGAAGVNSLTVTGAAGVGSLTASGAAGVNSLTVTNAAGVGSLTVTGAAGVNSLTVTGTASAATVNATTTNTTGITTSGSVSTINLSTAVAFISSINGINVNAFGGSTTTLPFLSTTSISSGTITAGAISTTSLSTAVSFISSINGVSFASLVNPVPTETISTFNQLFTSSFVASNINVNSQQTNQLYTSSFQVNNISSGIANIMQFNASSIQALDISTSTGYINQLNTSSIRGTNLSTGVGFINQLFASSIQAQNISSAALLTGTFSASTINAPLNFSLISTVANQGDIAGINTTLLKSFISLTSPIPLLNLTNQGGVPQVFNDSNFSYWNQCAFQAPTASPDVYAVSLSALVVNTAGQVDFYPGLQFSIQINYPGGSTIIGSFASGFPGQVRFTFAAGAWTFTNTFTGGSVTNSNNLQLSQNVSEVLLQTTDSLVISTALLDIRAPTNFQTLIAQQFNASTISTINTYSGYVQANLVNATSANISTITNANLFGSNAYATNINGATIICSTLTTSNIQNADAILVRKFQGTPPLAFNSLTNQYVTLSGGTAGTNARALTNQINFLTLPGMVDSGIPPGFPSGTTLTFTPAGQTLLNGNPAFPSLWFSSITSVDNSATGKTVNFQIPTGGNGEVVMLTNGINNVSVQSNGVTAAIVTTIGYTKLTWNSNVFTTQNVGTFSPYPSTMVTQDTRIHTGANNAMNFINKQTLFNGDAPVIFFQNFTGNFTGSPVGAASGGGVLSYNGSNFLTSQWSCYLSFYNINLAQNNLAINNFNVTATAIGSNWGAYCYTGTATVAGGATTGVNWNVQCMMVPKEFSLIQNFNKLGEEPPEQPLPPSTFTSTIGTFARLDLPDVGLSSIKAFAVTIEAIENIGMSAGLPPPTFFGNGDIIMNASTNIELGATNVLGLNSLGDVFIGAGGNISLSAPETKLVSGFLNMENRNIENVRTIRSPSTINISSPSIYLNTYKPPVITFQTLISGDPYFVADQEITIRNIGSSVVDFLDVTDAAFTNYYNGNPNIAPGADFTIYLYNPAPPSPLTIYAFDASGNQVGFQFADSGGVLAVSVIYSVGTSPVRIGTLVTTVPPSGDILINTSTIMMENPVTIIEADTLAILNRVTVNQFSDYYAISQTNYGSGLNFGTDSISFGAVSTMYADANYVQINSGGDMQISASNNARIITSTISIEGGSGWVNVNDTHFTTNYPGSWNPGSIHTLYGDVLNGGKYLQWSYNNTPGTNIVDNDSITLNAPTVSRVLSATTVSQPVLQYGTTSSSGNNGSVIVTLPVAYTSGTSYVAFVTMEDANPAEMSCVRNSASEIEIFWAQAGSGSHTVAWNTMGT
jgi:hypothetical protein